MYKPKTAPYLIEVYKDGQWLIVGSSKTQISALARAISDLKALRAEKYRITNRLTGEELKHLG